MRLPDPTLAARTLALLAPSIYALSAVGVQALHPLYDWREAPLSFYLSGPQGPWLQLAYAVLALGIVALGWACWRAQPSRAQAVAALLFAGGGTCLLLTAVFPGGSPEHFVPASQHRLHALVASGAFLLTGLAMLVQGRCDWRRSLRAPLLLALFALLLLVASQWRALLPRGLGQKLAIAGYLLFLTVRAHRLPRAAIGDVPGRAAPNPVS